MTRATIWFVIILSTLQAKANIVYNGSFESPAVNDVYWAGETIGGAWTVGGGGVEVGDWWVAASGVRSVDLCANDATGAIRQILFITAGLTYQLRFALAGNPDGGSGVKRMQLSVSDEWGGSLLKPVLSFDTTGHSRSNMGWLYYEYTFTPPGGTIVALSFASLENNYYGPTVDDVSVDLVPEPCMMLMLALASVGIIQRKRA